MKVKLVMVTTINGKMTRGKDNDIYKWTSKEDQEQFFSLIEKSNLIVMGRKTYEAAKPYMKLVPGKLRIVMTKKPKKYQSQQMNGQLEFSSESPKALVTRLEKMGYEEMLLVGGSKIAADFFRYKLIQHVTLTLEPYLFGHGEKFIDNNDLQVNLKLIKFQKINSRGTLLLDFQVEE